jgi:hypothetical protein
MPSQVLWSGPQIGVGWEIDSPAMKVTQWPLLTGVFIEGRVRDNHSVVIVQRPKPLVKHPVGILAKRNPILWIVVSGLGELVDVGSVNDRGAVNCRDAISRQGAGVVVSSHNV